MRLLPILMLLAYCSTAHSLEIVAPEQVEEHELVTVSFEHSGHALVLIQREGSTQYINTKRLLQPEPVQAYVFTGPPGKYTILVATFSPEQGFVTQNTHVLIGKAPRPPPEDPEEPSPSFEELTKLSGTLADQLNDPPTRQLLKTAYDAAQFKIKDKVTVESCKAIVSSTISNALKSRTGASLDVAWDKWRFPIDALLVSSNITTVSQYREALKAISKGL